MSATDLVSTAMLLGGDRQLFGIRTSAEGAQGSTGAIILNAGLLHNVGPFRLHVDIANDLAALGVPSLRIDQSGKGESPTRAAASRREAVLLDYDDAYSALQDIGIEHVILVGLCSGADDAMQIASQRDTVGGLIMFDGYARQTPQFEENRKSVARNSHKAIIRGTLRRLAGLLGIGKHKSRGASIDIRDWDGDARMTEILVEFLDGGGHILAVFTPGQDYYNYEGQFLETVNSSGDTDRVREIFYEDTDHTFSRVAHRERLRSEINAWTESMIP